MSQPPDLPPGVPEGPRASDEDRDRIVAVLKDRYVAGQISLEEFAERAETALASRTRAELEVLTRDLAPVTLPSQTTLAPAGRVKRATQWSIAFMSGHNRRGRWRIEGQTKAIAFMGGVMMDLREAQLVPEPGTDEVEILAIAFMGGVDIRVPEGVPVVVSGFSFMGGNDDRSSPARYVPGIPTVHIRAYSMMGGVSVRTVKSKEALESERAARHEERRRRHEERRLRHQESRELRRAREPRALRRPAAPPWVERVVAQTLGPSGLERIIGELEARGADPGVLTSLEAVASWVAGDRTGVDLRSVTAPDGTVTILFTDIEGSSSMNERLGDQQWLLLLREHNRIIRELLHEHGGTEVRSLGDGFMFVFSSARRALHCAVAIQRAFEVYAHDHPDEPIRVRIGCHTGEAIREADDFFGRNVVLAARIADQAKGGEILVSSLVKELTDSSGDVSFGTSRDVVLDGLTGTRTIYEVMW